MLKSIYALVFTSSLAFAQTMPTAAIYSGCTVPMTVALTFDDGPWIYQNVISEMLDSKGAKGTFFMNGYNYECIYGQRPVERLLETFKNGHQICSHTWDHRDLSTLNATEIRDEADKMDAALFKILGVNTTFFRPPYGSYNNLVREALSDKTFILWDFDSGDSVGKTPQQSMDLYDAAISNNVTNLLALNHEPYKTTAYDVLPYALDKLQAAGYKITTVAECLDLEPYVLPIGQPGVCDETWFCPEEGQSWHCPMAQDM
ncbi:glycoside hydrolase/deacetylase [Mycena sanguinolenta]|nr:glycoside hydrolase/deacetylase [Mycena sanguinolenta]